MKVVGGRHVYESTYCGHGEHDRCRLTCKICKTLCVCLCHIPLTANAFPELVGLAEIMAILGFDRADEVMAQDGFPDPVARLKAGDVWLRSDVDAFIQAWKRRPK